MGNQTTEARSALEEIAYLRGKQDGYMEGAKAAKEIMIKLLATQANPNPIHISGKDIETILVDKLANKLANKIKGL